MFCGTDSILWNIPHIQNSLNVGNILWNIVSPTEHCYECEYCYVIQEARYGTLFSISI